MSDGLRNILVTAALPYANGSLHLGHCLEFIQADVWVRFQRMMGHTCHFVCGSDAHGTPIMLSAEAKKITPEALVTEIQAEHQATLASLNIALDEFYTTHSPENAKNAAYFFKQLEARGDIAKRVITQYYDPEKSMFLPDRYIKGTCPRCDAADQYGDNCEVCGASYDIHELKSPRSSLTGATPVEKETEHFFFELGHYQSFLRDWLAQGHLQREVANKLGEWLQEELKAWDISRDGPYFGFEIPGAPNRFFYVWLDAPMGYIASFEHYANRVGHPEWVEQYWKADSKTELYQFIGKDIIYFHGLFWPALLQGAGYRLPSGIFSHGFVTVQGQKMSKSRGTFITAQKFLEHASAESLRYYFATKLTAQITDIDLDVLDLASRVNSDLVGKYANLASRCSALLSTHFNRTVCATDDAVFQRIVAIAAEVATHYDQRNTHMAMASIRDISDTLNRYIDEHKVWHLVKDPAERERAHTVLSTALSGFRLLTGLLKPVLPDTAHHAEQFLNTPLNHWSDALTALPAGHML
ncbi:MAG: methionine--tRNA ligase, partial [Pseudomonadota bacterium]